MNTCVLCCVCFRLLAQLRDMEEAFDGFFEKHHLKLQQYLQLLQYEMSFQQVGRWPPASCLSLYDPRVSCDDQPSVGVCV